MSTFTCELFKSKRGVQRVLVCVGGGGGATLQALHVFCWCCGPLGPHVNKRTPLLTCRRSGVLLLLSIKRQKWWSMQSAKANIRNENFYILSDLETDI